MATIGALTLDVLDLLYGSGQAQRPAQDTLATSVSDASDTSWQWTSADLWKRGDLAEYWPGDGSEGEVVYIAEDAVASTDKAVRRAQLQTTAASSYSAGDVFQKNPPYPAVKVQRAIQQTVDLDLSPDIFYRSQRTLTPIDGTQYYELDDEDFDVETVYQYDLNSVTSFDPIPNTLWEVETDVASGVASSNRILRLYHWYSTSTTVYYTARSKYMYSDLANIPDEVADIIQWGAVARILAQTAPTLRIDPARSSALAQGAEANQLYQDAEYFRSRFEEMKGRFYRRLTADKRRSARYRRPGSIVVRR